ncbi:hypothetical protein M9H77_27524 [Catharanthus roseus]|uniref:Uncharacterized protein n=1 Tax=Catharanthus roseus TaxID=4058 RepID=A0ACC0ADR5_CATRO|nr:hypothetical protein M9H77_27524 [Catharanthus roseus]
MGNPPLLSLRFAFVFSVSLAASYATTSASLSFPRPKFRSQSAISVPKATAKDLLALLGPPQLALSVNQQEAEQLKSCFKFLVPCSPACQTQPVISGYKPARRSLSPVRFTSKENKEAEVNELIWWPPEPVFELARLAVDSGGDPGVIHGALDPTIIKVPDVEGSKEERCELTRTSYGRRFINEELNSYLKFLFEIIEARGPSVGLNVSLNRYDLFHGHLFLAVDSGRLGILFHAKEYPAYDKDVFPCNMGYCQIGSNVTCDNSMNLRNILWLAPLPSNSTKTWLAPGVLVVLDARPDGIIYKDLIPEYVHIARTLYEDDFGEVAVDVNYLNVGTKASRYEIFLC